MAYLKVQFQYLPAEKTVNLWVQQFFPVNQTALHGHYLILGSLFLIPFISVFTLSLLFLHMNSFTMFLA
jgi:hypothetical protein